MSRKAAMSGNRQYAVDLVEIDRECVAVGQGDRGAVVPPADQRLGRRRRVVEDGVLERSDRAACCGPGWIASPDEAESARGLPAGNGADRDPARRVAIRGRKV